MIAPDRKIPGNYVNLGALFTSVGWILSTGIYLFYVRNFAKYSLYYSGLTNIAILMIWIYILATIFVIGMGLNLKREHEELERTQALNLSGKNNHNNRENKN